MNKIPEMTEEERAAFDKYAADVRERALVHGIDLGENGAKVIAGFLMWARGASLIKSSDTKDRSDGEEPPP